MFKEPVKCVAPVVVAFNTELKIVIKESASYWPNIEEEMESEISKEERQVLTATNVSVQSLAHN